MIHGAAQRDTCEAVWEEMAPYVKQVTAESYGAQGAVLTRPGCVLARSKASWDLALHPLVLELCDGVLGRQVLAHPTATECAAQLYPDRGLQQHPYQLDLTKMIAVGPGSGAQDLHQDAGKHLLDLRPLRLEVSVSLVWALGDFTAAAGATRVCPGSHRWYHTCGPTARPPAGETGIAAEMPAGSLLFMLGNVWHGAGPNTTKATRKGLTIDYSLAYMRQEENMYLAVPPPVALAIQMPKRLLKLIGYQPAGNSMGYVDDGDSPLVLLAGTNAKL